MIFRALPEHVLDPVLAKFSAPQEKFWKKVHFLENFNQKVAFFSARAPPSKLVY